MSVSITLSGGQPTSSLRISGSPSAYVSFDHTQREPALHLRSFALIGRQLASSYRTRRALAFQLRSPSQRSRSDARLSTSTTLDGSACERLGTSRAPANTLCVPTSTNSAREHHQRHESRLRVSSTDHLVASRTPPPQNRVIDLGGSCILAVVVE